MERREKDGWELFLVAIISLLLVIFFYKQLLNLISADFVKNFLVLVSITLLGSGFIAFQEKQPELKRNLLDASIYNSVAFLSSLLYLGYPYDFILKVNFGVISMIAFLGGFMYFFLILIQERIKLK